MFCLLLSIPIAPRIIKLPALVFALFLFVFVPSGKGQNIDIDSITKTWWRTEKSVRSGRFSWTIKHTYFKGSILSINLPPAFNPKKETVPPDDYSFEGKSTFTFDGHKTRFQSKWQLWSTGKNRFVEDEKIEVCNGQVSKALTYKSKGADYLAGLIDSPSHCFPILNLQTKALISAFRPSFLKDSIRLKDLVISAQKQIHKGRTCIVLFEKLPPATISHIKTSTWVDPGRSFLPVRLIKENKNKGPMSIIDIELGQGEKGVWIPSSWRIALFFSNGQVQQTSEVKIDRYELNIPIPQSEFEIEFPPGTFVIDSTKSPIKYYMQKSGKL